MKITKQTDTELTLENNIQLLKKMVWFALGLLLISLIGFVFLRSVAVSPGFAETAAITFGAIVTGCGVTAVSLGILVLLESRNRPVRAVIFYKNANQIHFETSVVWRNWRVQTEKIPLDMITAVHFYRVGHYNVRLELAKTRWETIKLIQEQIGNSSLSVVAETISDFLNVPLLVFVGTEEPILRQPGTSRKEKDAFYDI